MISLKLFCVSLCLISLTTSIVAGDFLAFGAKKKKGTNENDYMTLYRSNCDGQDIDDGESGDSDVKKCMAKCDAQKDCKVFTLDTLKDVCHLKSACDKPSHKNGFNSFISKELCGAARPHHYIMTLYGNKEVLTASKISIHGGISGATLSIQPKNPNAFVAFLTSALFEKEQLWYAQEVSGTGYFKIFSPKNPKLVIDVKDRIAKDGQEVRLWPWDAWVVNKGQLWRWKDKKYLESALSSNYVLHVDPKGKSHVTLNKFIDGAPNQQWRFEV